MRIFLPRFAARTVVSEANSPARTEEPDRRESATGAAGGKTAGLSRRSFWQVGPVRSADHPDEHFEDREWRTISDGLRSRCNRQGSEGFHRLAFRRASIEVEACFNRSGSYVGSRIRMPRKAARASVKHRFDLSQNGAQACSFLLSPYIGRHRVRALRSRIASLAC